MSFLIAEDRDPHSIFPVPHSSSLHVELQTSTFRTSAMFDILHQHLYWKRDFKKKATKFFIPLDCKKAQRAGELNIMLWNKVLKHH